MVGMRQKDMERYHVDWKNTIKMSIQHRLIYRVNTISIKISITVFIEIEKYSKKIKVF